MLSLFMMIIISIAHSFDVIGWFVTGSTVCDEMITPDTFPYNFYTHIVVSNPIVDKNGTATCDTSDMILKRFVQLAKVYGKKIIWNDGLQRDIIWHILLNDSWAQYKTNYLSSIGTAVKECMVDGIEFDYECPDTIAGRAGVVSNYEATKYTEFLENVKTAIGTNKTVGADMGIFGVTPGSYPFMLSPWLNVSMIQKNTGIDYINIMSYHSNNNLFPWSNSSESIFPWKKDAYILTEIWGFPANKINIGIPYYSYNKTYNEPLWCQLSEQCPNIDPNSTTCAGIHIVSKEQNLEIAQYVKNNNFRGVFPWAANYDSLTYNNTMAEWVHKGLL